MPPELLEPLRLILDRLLPGNDAGWPAAGTLGLAPTVWEDAARTPEGEAAVRTVLAALPVDYAARPDAARDEALRAIEAAEPDAFARLVASAYNSYYTNPDVLAVVERLTGYEARPPQPSGYDLPPFDERLLDRQKQRPPFWRKT